MFESHSYSYYFYEYWSGFGKLLKYACMYSLESFEICNKSLKLYKLLKRE